MTRSGKNFAVLTALGLLLLCGFHGAHDARSAELNVEADESLSHQDIAYAILKSLVVRKIGAFRDDALVMLQDRFGLSRSASCVDAVTGEEMAVNR